MKKRKTAAQLLTLTICSLATVAASAATVTINLTKSNRPMLLPDDDYVQVTIHEQLNGDIDFLVETLDPVRDEAKPGEGYGLQLFAFNFGSSGATAENIRLPVNWRVGGFWPEPFGEFDVGLRTNPKNLRDPLKFSIVGVEGDTAMDYLTAASTGESRYGNHLFGTKVLGIDLRDNWGEEWRDRKCSEETGQCQARDVDYDQRRWREAKFAGGTVVPVPAAVWLFGSGLMGLVGLARRRQQA